MLNIHKLLGYPSFDSWAQQNEDFLATVIVLATCLIIGLVCVLAVEIYDELPEKGKVIMDITFLGVVVIGLGAFTFVMVNSGKC